MTEELKRPYGICDNPVVDGKILIDRQQGTFEQDNAIYTERNFGCIYHSPLHGNVVADIGKALNDDDE